MSFGGSSNTSAPGPVHPEGFKTRRVKNWVPLGLMYGFFYMSRYNLAAISQAIGEKFGWSNADYGKILSAGVLVYGLSVFLNGPLADKIGGKKAILIGSAGAAFFNLAFGFCHIYLAKEAVWQGGKVVSPAVFNDGMTTTTMIAMFSTLWALNHYFQSFGALSIVKINAAWFHVRERGKFAGIFGIMIQSGRLFAFWFSPFILRFLPWQYCFWIPAAILIVMFFFNLKYVEDSPAKASFEFHTADETAEEAAQKPSLGYVLKKVFASPAAWTIALASMCIGMVRNSVDHWWSRYISAVFHLKADQLASFTPYYVVSILTPLFAIAGGMAAGNVSDRVFGSRRAPVIFFAFVGQGVTLLLLSQGLHNAWAGAILLLVMAFFIQSAHSLVGGAASMDFGGKKAVATAAGLFDGAQYLAATLVGYGMGKLLDHFKDAKNPGVEFDVWPLAPIPFAIIGAILISRLWNVIPGRKTAPDELSAEEQARRQRRAKLMHTIERVALAVFALAAGSIALANLVLLQVVAREALNRTLPAPALLMSQLYGGVRLGLAAVALITAMMPRPSRALTGAILLGLAASIAGPVLSGFFKTIPWTDIAPLKKWFLFDSAIVLTLLTTRLLRK